LDERFAVSQGYSHGKLVAPLLQLLSDAMEKRPPRLACQRPPTAKSGMGVPYSTLENGPAEDGHLGEDCPSRGILDTDLLFRFDKFAMQVKRICFHRSYRMVIAALAGANLSITKEATHFIIPP
jgi:hypothetical protein